MDPTVVISFKDGEVDERVRETIEKRCQILAKEFPETTHLEISLAPDGAGFTAHGHVTGRDIDVASHAEAIDARLAADQLMDTLARQLRKSHDKRIFARRREAQRDRQRHRTGG